MPQSKITAIFAVDDDHILSINGELPWNIKEDLIFFKEKTLNSVVIMGRETYLSLPVQNRPLSGRINIVLSKTITKKELDGPHHICDDIFRAINIANNEYPDKNIYIIGGNKLLQNAFRYKYCDNAIITRIHENYYNKPDTEEEANIITELGLYNVVSFNPSSFCHYYEFISESKKTKVYDSKLKKDVTIQRGYYKMKMDAILSPIETDRIHNADEVYLKLVDNILFTKRSRSDRTGTGTLSIFGTHSVYNISNGRIPLLTTKNVSFKLIADELLWFLSGSTDSTKLKSKIWSGNTSRSFLDSRGLTNYKQGLIGPAYGFQWRYFGAEYDNITGEPRDNGKDNRKQHTDQLARVIDQLKNDPYSRRIIMTAWNPSELDKMALEPCHIMVQFYVSDPDPHDFDQRKYLECMLYQRSGDVGLGVPYNIVSYSLLCHMIGFIVNMRPLKFTHNIGDAHIYKNHIYQLENQLKKYNKDVSTTPYNEAKLKINYEINNDISSLENLLKIGQENFELNYVPGPTISMPMAV